MKRLLPLLVPALLLCGLTIPAQDSAWEHLNRIRTDRGRGELRLDPLLARVASDYAVRLVERGALSHRDPVQGSVLDRYRSAGGTAVIVGEIIGAGADLVKVLAAWERSEPHREVILNPGWTHIGSGSSDTGEIRIWVVLFSTMRVTGLSIRRRPEGFLLAGTFAGAEVAEPVLISGLSRLRPLSWRRESRQFRFLIPLEAGGDYHRLGYLDGEGKLKLTDVFYPERLVTSSPDRESQ